MDHWFDAFVKRIAQPPSRRMALAGLAGAAFGGAWTFRRDAAAQSAPVPDGTCVRQYQGAVMTQRLVVSEADLTLQHLVSYDRAAGTSRLDFVVLRRGALLINARTEMESDGLLATEIRYGDEIRGADRATAALTEERILRGTIGARAFIAPEHTQSMEDVVFTDGRARPRIEVDPALHAALRRLCERAASVSAACRTAAASEPAIAEEVAQFWRRDARPEGGFQLSQPQRLVACDPCLDACAGAAECVGNLPMLIGTIFDVPVWCAKVNACLAYHSTCLSGCYAPGGGCCPVQCGGFECCGAGETCMNEHHACCPQGRAVCSGHCCGPGVDTCAADGFCGCQSGYTPCGDECCGVDQVCCGGQRCCAADACQNGVC